MTASVPSRIALATSATSARVGRDEVTIESSICVAVIDGRAMRAGQGEQALLDHRHLLDGHLDAQVAARDHHAVGDLEDLLGALDALRLLDLGDERHARVLAHEEDVLGPAHEAQRDEVDADLLAGAQVLEVLLGHGGEDVERAGDVQALARGDDAADLDLGVELAVAGAHRDRAQAHRAVGEVEDLARLDGVGEAVPGDRHPPRVARPGCRCRRRR